jgi:hypothetical protein
MAALFGRLYRQAFKASVERQLQSRELARHAYLGVPAE